MLIIKIGIAPNFTQILVNDGVAEFYMASNGIANGQAIRVHNSKNNLNVVAPITVIDANHFTITYKSLSGTVPSNGIYTSSNDPQLYVTRRSGHCPLMQSSAAHTLCG